MPVITVVTNLGKGKFVTEFRRLFIDLMAETLKKPREGIALILNAESDCSFGITNDPCAIIHVKSIGSVSAEENIRHTKVITEFFGKHVGLQPDRMLIHFENLEKHEVGKNGTTVQDALDNESDDKRPPYEHIPSDEDEMSTQTSHTDQALNLAEASLEEWESEDEDGGWVEEEGEEEEPALPAPAPPEPAQPRRQGKYQERSKHC